MQFKKPRDTHHTASELLQGGASALLCFRLESQRKNRKRGEEFNIAAFKANIFACISTNVFTELSFLKQLLDVKTILLMQKS